MKPTIKTGDIVIVKKLIANNKYQYTSYVYAGQLATSGKIVNFDIK